MPFGGAHARNRLRAFATSSLVLVYVAHTWFPDHTVCSATLPPGISCQYQTYDMYRGTPRQIAVLYDYFSALLTFIPLFFLQDNGYVATAEIAAPTVLAYIHASFVADVRHVGCGPVDALAATIAFPVVMIAAAFVKHGRPSRRNEANVAVAVAIVLMMGTCVAADDLKRNGSAVAATVLVNGLACGALAATHAVEAWHDSLSE